MKPQLTTALYWFITLLFAAFMLLGGLGNLLQTEDGLAIMRQLGYPPHSLLVIGSGKVLGALALVQTRFRTVKEWAYAGSTIDLVGAAAAWFSIGAGVALGLFPLFFLLPMIASYVLWKRMQPHTPKAPRADPALPVAA
ncbi:DoxX family protein [Hymenobacter coalescens]